MRLRQLNGQKVWGHIMGLSVRLERRGISFREKVISSSKQRPKSLILIGDGTPDDYIVALLAFKFNGRKPVWLTKPERTGTAIFGTLHTYLRMGRELNEILVLIDQDANSESEVFERAREVLEGTRIVISEDKRSSRLGVLSCGYGGRTLKLIVLMNGLDIPKLKKHTVEDHLLKAMGLRLGEGKVERLLREAEYDPKSTWGKLSRKERNEVIEGLFEMEEEKLKYIFPQHFEAFGLLNTS